MRKFKILTPKKSASPMYTENFRVTPPPPWASTTLYTIKLWNRFDRPNTLGLLSLTTWNGVNIFLKFLVKQLRHWVFCGAIWLLHLSIQRKLHYPLVLSFKKSILEIKVTRTPLRGGFWLPVLSNIDFCQQVASR